MNNAAPEVAVFLWETKLELHMSGVALQYYLPS